mgnify:CR=1 FL=1
MNKTMSKEQVSDSYVWSANDWSNIVTISAAAIASVLLVVFKSRCKNISLCWGLWSCVRDVVAEHEEEMEDPKKVIDPPVLIPPKPGEGGRPSVFQKVNPPPSA